MNIQPITDKSAVALSFICVLHCFLAPSLLVFTSSFISLSTESESIHKLIIFAAVPISMTALILGYQNHKKITFLSFGILGLAILVFAAIAGEYLLGEYGEKWLTLAGSSLTAFCHYKNFITCRKLDCACHS
ncbi:MAG: MerC domain-containing protein [Gammaproteobacteria bacterium]|jgi:predicted permease|nr:MerC domain-containing protein [Gammaproteobacteria bacterium]